MRGRQSRLAQSLRGGPFSLRERLALGLNPAGIRSPAAPARLYLHLCQRQRHVARFAHFSHLVPLRFAGLCIAAYNSASTWILKTQTRQSH